MPTWTSRPAREGGDSLQEGQATGPRLKRTQVFETALQARSCGSHTVTCVSQVRSSQEVYPVERIAPSVGQEAWHGRSRARLFTVYGYDRQLACSRSVSPPLVPGVAHQQKPFLALIHTGSSSQVLRRCQKKRTWRGLWAAQQCAACSSWASRLLQGKF